MTMLPLSRISHTIHYNPDTAATTGESFFNSGNIRLQPEWTDDYASQLAKA